MFGIFDFFTNLIQILYAILALAATGALVGFGCALVSRLVTGISGYAIAAAAGALMMVGAHYGGVLDQFASSSAKQKIADLRAEKAKLAFELEAARKVRKFEQDQSADAVAYAEEVELRMAVILAAIAKHDEDENCDTAAFEDELDAIRNLR
jgi:hypothetical protein